MEWVEKYKPKVLSECFNTYFVNQIKNWLDNWTDNNENIRNSLLLIGPSGVGKSHYAKLLLEDYKFNKIIECNANDVRTYNSLTKIINSTIGSKGIYKLIENMDEKKTAIIMDEIEGVTLGDKGCMKKILELIYIKSKNKTDKKIIKSRCPIINICSSLENSKVSQIKKHSTILFVKYPTKEELNYLADKIFKGENNKFLSDTILKHIINKRNYDYRSFFFFMKELFLISKHKKITKKLVDDILILSQDKRQDLDMYQATRKMLRDKNLSYDFLLNTYKTYQSVIPYIMYDNFKVPLSELKSTPENINDLVDYLDDASLGNIFEHFIYDEQIWELSNFSSIVFFKRANILAQKHKIDLERLSYSTILNKLSKILYNHKLTKQLMEKFEIENYQLTNLGSMILETLFIEDSEKIASVIEYLKTRGVVQMDIDKLVKFNLFFKEYEDKYNQIYKRKLKNLLEGKSKRKSTKKTKKPKKIKKSKKKK